MTYRVFSAMVLALSLADVVHAQQSNSSGPAESSGAASAARVQAIDPELAEMTADEIAGRPLLNTKNEKIGQVEFVVRDLQDGSLKAVTNVGGFFGVGSRRVVVPLTGIRFEEDRLVTTLADSSGELEDRSSGFDEDRYPRLLGETRIADATAAAQEFAGIRFDTVDANGDGFISAQEARGHEALAGRWNALDVNRDGRLDRGEFAVFEEQTGASPGVQDQNRRHEQAQTHQRDSVRDENLRQRDQSPRQRDLRR